MKLVDCGFQKYGNKWFLPRSLWNIKLKNGKLDCLNVIPAEINPSLMVNSQKDLSQWRLNGQITEERKYVIDSEQINSPTKTPLASLLLFSTIQILFSNNLEIIQNTPASTSNLINTSTDTTSNRLLLH